MSKGLKFDFNIYIGIRAINEIMREGGFAVLGQCLRKAFEAHYPGLEVLKIEHVGPGKPLGDVESLGLPAKKVEIPSPEMAALN